MTPTLGPEDNTATRSDGVSIGWLLRPDAQPLIEADGEMVPAPSPEEIPGWLSCTDPYCPVWAGHVKSHDSFYVHYHAES